MITVKDSKGQYVKVPDSRPDPVPTRTDVSIDSLLNKGLLAIERTMKQLVTKSCGGGLDRQDVQNLKDLISMLTEMKEKEDAILDKMSDEELEAYVNANR